MLCPLGNPYFLFIITDHVASVVVAQLLFLEAEDPDKDICIYIGENTFSTHSQRIYTDI